MEPSRRTTNDDRNAAAAPGFAQRGGTRANHRRDGGGGAPADMPLSAMREQMLAIQQYVSGLQLATYAVDVPDGVIEGVPVRTSNPRVGPAQGVLLNAHGGGFMVDSGSLSENVPLCALTGMKIVAVLYRLAPEHPYPAAVDDMVAVYRSIIRDTGPERIALYGHRRVRSYPHRPSFGCSGRACRCPLPWASFPVPATSHVLAIRSNSCPCQAGQRCWSSSAAMLRRRRGRSGPVAAVRGPDRFSASPVDLHTRDQLLSQTAIFHRALLKAQVPAQLVVFEGLPHAFWAYLIAPECTDAFEFDGIVPHREPAELGHLLVDITATNAAAGEVAGRQLLNSDADIVGPFQVIVGLDSRELHFVVEFQRARSR